MVFDRKSISYEELLEAIRENYNGREALRQQLLNRAPKYGNGDPAADRLAARLYRNIMDTARMCSPEDGYIKFPAIYSLYHQVSWGSVLGATPDGRLAGDPISENELPTKGMDRNGITAMLSSVAAMPQVLSPMGGVTVTFGGTLPQEEFIALMDAYFTLGGKHLGYTQVTRRQLLEAEEHPEQYRNLCVRVTGFSEYYLALSPQNRKDVLARTIY
jgi:formate C-acetyltransferase